MRDMIALKKHAYGTGTKGKGERYQALPGEARTLVALGWALDVTDEGLPPAPKPDTSVKLMTTVSIAQPVEVQVAPEVVVEQPETVAVAPVATAEEPSPDEVKDTPTPEVVAPEVAAPEVVAPTPRRQYNRRDMTAKR